MVTGALAGAGIGLGLLLAWRGLLPPRPTLARSLAELDAAASWRPASVAAATPARVRWLFRWQVWLADRLLTGFTDRGWLTEARGADLAVLGLTPSGFFARKVAYAGVGFLAPALSLALLSVAGVELPLLVPMWATLGCAAAGFVWPDATLHQRATGARRDHRVAVGAYLDLVAMRMASGAGLAEALTEAAELGTGPAFARLRGTLADARTDGLSSAAALGRLGEQLGLADLIDTAARLELVGSSGAQAEASLRAQAASLRDRELSEIQGQANERSQSMLVAQVVLGLGFLIFLGYPAVAKVLAT